MTLGRRLPRATALAAMGLMLALGACGESDTKTIEIEVPDVDAPEVDDGAVPDVPEMVTYTCGCGKTKEVALDAPAPS